MVIMIIILPTGVSVTLRAQVFWLTVREEMVIKDFVITSLATVHVYFLF